MIGDRCKLLKRYAGLEPGTIGTVTKQNYTGVVTVEWDGARCPALMYPHEIQVIEKPGIDDVYREES